MQPTKCIWINGEFVPWDECKVHALTHTLHYGAGTFEGIRVYETSRGPAIFRLREHLERLLYSAGVIAMQIPYSVEQLAQVAIELVHKNELRQGYLRPLAFYGYGVMGLRPIGAPVEVMMACWPWGKYLPHDMVDVKVSKYIRISPRSTVTDAKLVGHYVNSILATLEIRDSKYHEALFLDENGDVAEGPGENLFIVKDGMLITPRLGAILPGITRATVMTIAQDLGIRWQESVLSLEDVYAAQEAFFTGTAAEISPIKSVDDRLIGASEVGPVTSRLQQAYAQVTTGRNPRYSKMLSHVELSIT